METRSRRARSDHRAALPQLPYHNGGSPEAPVDPGSERVDQISGYVGTVLGAGRSRLPGSMIFDTGNDVTAAAGVNPRELMETPRRGSERAVHEHGNEQCRGHDAQRHEQAAPAGPGGRGPGDRRKDSG
jgi:hypothetical protein